MERKPIIFQTRWPQIHSHLLLQENTWGTAVPGSQAGTQLSDLAIRTNREESSQAEGRAYVTAEPGWLTHSPLLGLRPPVPLVAGPVRCLAES